MYKDIVRDIFSETPVLLLTQEHVNPDTGFLFRYVYGHTENLCFHNHEFYEVFLTISGNTIHCVNGEVQILEPGCLVFIRPDDSHCYMYLQKNYSFINLTISCDIINSMFAYLSDATDIGWLTKNKMPPVTRLTMHEMQSFLKRADIFNAISNDDTITQKLNIRTFLMDVFIKYFIRRKDETRSDIPLWLEETCEKMKKPENFTVGIKRMVAISGKTQEHLSRTLRRYYNVSLSQFVNDLRLNYAVNLIVHTNLKIADICYESGFGNISSFYALFSDSYNMSPKEFRTLHSI